MTENPHLPRPSRSRRLRRSAETGPAPSGDEPEEIRALARRHARAAIAALAEILGDPEARASNRVAAASAILDRAYGRPAPVAPEGGPAAPAEPLELSEAERLHRIAALLDGAKPGGRA